MCMLYVKLLDMERKVYFLIMYCKKVKWLKKTGYIIWTYICFSGNSFFQGVISIAYKPLFDAFVQEQFIDFCMSGTSLDQGPNAAVTNVLYKTNASAPLNIDRSVEIPLNPISG